MHPNYQEVLNFLAQLKNDLNILAVKVDKAYEFFSVPPLQASAYQFQQPVQNANPYNPPMASPASTNVRDDSEYLCTKSLRSDYSDKSTSPPHSPDIMELEPEAKRAKKIPFATRRQCPQCEMWFINKFTLMRHMKNIHKNAKKCIFQCIFLPEACVFKVHTRGGILRHIHSHLRKLQSTEEDICPDLYYVQVAVEDGEIVYAPPGLQNALEAGVEIRVDLDEAPSSEPGIFEKRVQALKFIRDRYRNSGGETPRSDPFAYDSPQ